MPDSPERRFPCAGKQCLADLAETALVPDQEGLALPGEGIQVVCQVCAVIQPAPSGLLDYIQYHRAPTTGQAVPAFAVRIGKRATGAVWATLGRTQFAMVEGLPILKIGLEVIGDQAIILNAMLGTLGRAVDLRISGLLAKELVISGLSTDPEQQLELWPVVDTVEASRA